MKYDNGFLNLEVTFKFLKIVANVSALVIRLEKKLSRMEEERGGKPCGRYALHLLLDPVLHGLHVVVRGPLELLHPLRLLRRDGHLRAARCLKGLGGKYFRCSFSFSPSFDFIFFYRATG